MNMMDLLRGAQGGDGIEALSRSFGLERGKTEDVLRQLLPAVSTGFKARASERGGLESLLREVNGTDYEDIHRDLPVDRARQRGDDVLGRIFGSKDVSRAVARRTEDRTGVGADVVKKMLPVVASMVMGGMQRRTTDDRDMGGLLGMLGSDPGASARGGGGGLDAIIGAALGGKDPKRAGPEPRGGGGLGGILDGILGGRKPATQPRRAPEPEPERGGLDDLLGGIFGQRPKERRSSGDRRFDDLIGMFDADGDGRVDRDVLRDIVRGRR